ncbi:hypothetical protein OQA88_5756 [Cercophora sp. LCS_1]
MIPPILWAVGTRFLAIAAVFVLFRRYQKLGHIPGPFLAAFTDLWRARIQFFDSFIPTLINVHEQYGPIVRIGPNTVSISDPSFIPIIASPRGGFAKADSYSPLRVFINGKSIGSLLDMQDEPLNRAIKRAVGPAFSAKNLLPFQPDLTRVLDALISNIRRYHLGGGPFNLYTTIQYFQLDFLFLTAFSTPPTHLPCNTDPHEMASTLYRRIFHWYAWQPLPRLERLIFQNRFLSKHIPSTPSLWAAHSARQITTRLSKSDPSPSSSSETSRPDLLQTYISLTKSSSTPQPLTSAHQIPPSLLPTLTNSTISAGADTTSGALTAILYLILRHAHIHRTLLSELTTAKLHHPISYTQVQPLPYLDAVVREALRLSAPLAIPLERVVPKGGCRLGDTYLPPGTVVGVAPKVVHNDSEVFGDDTDTFRPERFLRRTREEIATMERANLAWGLGGRVCLGRNMAEMEIKVVVPTLLLSFDFKLCSPELDLAWDWGTFEMQRHPIMVTVSERNGT